jgi:hypothetical protein
MANTSSENMCGDREVLTDAATDGFPAQWTHEVTSRRDQSMADEWIVSLLELLRKADPTERADFVRQATERVAQAIVELELEQKIGAARYERTETRTNSRNGSAPVSGTPRQVRCICAS